jgi:DNA processing protein
MRFTKETKSLVHLSIIPGVGYQTIRRLLTAFESAQRALDATLEELTQVEGLTANISQQLVSGKSRVSVDQELELIEAHNCHVLAINDSAYPMLLKEIADPPPLLYVRGELGQPDAPSITIVGTRSPTNYGKTISRQLSQQLAESGITVISGFARGIDTCAHQGALQANGRTIAVLGNGLSQIYPAENRELADEIMKSGALISEFPMTVPPFPKNFPRRNRVVSGMSSGTVVVEASIRSGSLITARHAAEQGREVFAVPGQIFSNQSKGSHQLINQGAKLINAIDDIWEAFPNRRLTPSLTSPPIQLPLDQNDSARGRVNSNLFAEVSARDTSIGSTGTSSANPSVQATQQLSTDERAILEAIGVPCSHIDQIARTTALPMNKVSSALVMLELKGIVQQMPGKQFARQS